MRTLLPLFASAFLLAACSSTGEITVDTPPNQTQGEMPDIASNVDLIQKYQSTITASELAGHLYFFASDYFEGRETTTRGQKFAAEYLAAEYRKMGLEPKGNDKSDVSSPESYMQSFNVYGNRFQSSSLTANAGSSTLFSGTFSPDSHDDEMLLVFGNVADVEAPLVFGGYGISDDDLGFNELSAMADGGIDASQAWVMLLNGEPMKNAEESLLPTEDGKASAWSGNQNTKLRAFMSSGSMPKGFILVGDVGPGVDETISERAARAASRQDAVGSLSLEEGSNSRPFPPIYMVSTQVANQMLAPSGRSVADLEKAIAADLKPDVFTVEGVTLSSSLANESFAASTENVVAYIEGSDPVLKDEVVVFSSHYDHIGMRDAGDEDGINNGADDDGSGTVTLLEIAEAFMDAKHDGVGPRRSLIFLNVTGEEKGLLGSAHYADSDPRHPLDKTVTNLNIDMIGRFDPTHPGEDNDYVYIIGSNMISQELHDINDWANTSTGIGLDLNERFNSRDDPNRFYARSDHWNFGKHGIPFIFYFTGTHEDYHGVGDEAHKIEYDRMARIGQLIFATGWRVANQDARPAVSGEGFN